MGEIQKMFWVGDISGAKREAFAIHSAYVGINIEVSRSEEKLQELCREMNEGADAYADKRAQEKVGEFAALAISAAKSMKDCWNKGEDAKTATNETANAIANLIEELASSYAKDGGKI